MNNRFQYLVSVMATTHGTMWVADQCSRILARPVTLDEVRTWSQGTGRPEPLEKDIIVQLFEPVGGR